MLSEALAGRRRLLGSQHPDTVATESALATLQPTGAEDLADAREVEAALPRPPQPGRLPAEALRVQEVYSSERNRAQEIFFTSEVYSSAAATVAEEHRVKRGRFEEQVCTPKS